jgi:hypothetical protein
MGNKSNIAFGSNEQGYNQQKVRNPPGGRSNIQFG